MRGYDERRQLMRDLMKARATDPQHQDVPGIQTGLLVVRYVGVGKVRYKEARFDGSLQRALLEVEKQAAIERGEWVERADNTLRWDGDPSKLNGQQLDNVMRYLEQVAYNNDPEKIAAARREALGLPTGEVVEGTVEAETPKIVDQVQNSPDWTERASVDVSDDLLEKPQPATRSWADIADRTERARLAQKWRDRGPQMPEGMDLPARIAWMNEHWPLDPE